MLSEPRSGWRIRQQSSPLPVPQNPLSAARGRFRTFQRDATLVGMIVLTAVGLGLTAATVETLLTG